MHASQALDRQTRLDALVRQVHARPDTDDARLVLADALLAEDDPRGELIALQLAHHGREDTTPPRADQLLREHGRRWLGSLREITYRARFARGFLTRLELNGTWTASEDAWARHAAEPMLATVEDLIPGRAVGQIYAQFVASPAMAALRRIEVFDRPTLAALRDTPARLVHVSCPSWKGGRYVQELTAHVLPACARFAALRSLAVHLDGAPSVLTSHVVHQLGSLTVAGGLANGLALWPRLPQAISLTIARSAKLDDCASSRMAMSSGELTLWREAGGVFGRASGSMLRELVGQFSALPIGLHRLEVEGAGAYAQVLGQIAAERGIELVLRPPARRIGYFAVPDTR